MADQPLNTDIQIFRTVRSQRAMARNDSIKNITGRLRRLFLVEPGREIYTSYGARMTSVTDFSPFMGEARPLASRGLPITIGVRAVKDFSAIETMVGVDFPVVIGQDAFVQETAATVGGDIQQSARDATTATNVTL